MAGMIYLGINHLLFIILAVVHLIADGLDGLIAKASNFKHSYLISCQEDLDNFISVLPPSDGPIFANIKIESKNPPRSLPILDGVEIKNRFRRSLGFDPL